MIEGKIKLGVSDCLLGSKVRYDGGHKLNHFIKDTLGQFVQFVPVCPESECGLGIPREAMHLMGDADNPRLVTIRTHIDHTERMLKWGKKRVEQLAKENLSGFIFKSKSPSSGMERIKLYTEAGMPYHSKGIGLFAKMFMERFPLLPVEDEGRLNDATLRENFIERIFVYRRWLQSENTAPQMKNFLDFHTRHKLLIMSHGAKVLSELGKIVGSADHKSLRIKRSEYISMLMKGLKFKATVKKNVTVLHHIMGYFKKVLSADEKQELLDIIQNYHQHLIPLIVPITLLNHYVRKYQQSYLMQQFYLNPHPMELMLRNHV